MSDRPFVYIDQDENVHYYPEAIIGFLFLVLMGCIMGGLMAIGMWTVFDWVIK